MGKKVLVCNILEIVLCAVMFFLMSNKNIISEKVVDIALIIIIVAFLLILIYLIMSYKKEKM